LNLAAFTFFPFAPLPLEYYPGFPIYRPAEMLAGVFYCVATVGHWRKGAWKVESFEHWLMLYLATSTIALLVYVPWSTEFFDAINCVSHVLGIMASSFLLAGLLSSIVSIFPSAERALHDQEHVSESLTQEVAIRQRAEAELEEARRKLEVPVAKRTEELAEQDEFANRREDRGRSHPVRRHRGDATAFRRNHLQFDGREFGSDLDCKQRRRARTQSERWGFMPVWKDLNTCPLVNSGLDAWLRKANRSGRMRFRKIPWWETRNGYGVGIVAYAGQPLMLEDRVEGVVMVCATKPLKDAAVQALGSVAGSRRLFVGRRRAEAALVESEELVRLLLDSTAEAIYGVDLKGSCIFANQAGMRALGYQKQEDLLGKKMHTLAHHSYAEGRPHLASECQIFQALRRGEPSHADDDVFWRADGTSFPV
jgi:PAS domain S-box-containing protein